MKHKTLKTKKHIIKTSKIQTHEQHAQLHHHKKANLQNTLTCLKPKGTSISRSRYKSTDIKGGNKYCIEQQKSKLNLSKEDNDFLMLVLVLIDIYTFLHNNKVPSAKRKQFIVNILKSIRSNNHFIKKNTTNEELSKIYNIIDSKIGAIKPTSRTQTQTQTYRNKHQYGGFYFKSLEEKGNKPITGTDLTTLLDEMQDFFYNAKYTQEGEFLVKVDTLISMLRGDINQFKSFLSYQVLPQFYQTTPPFIKLDGFKKALDTKKYEDLPDYLLAYQKYLKSRDEYLVAKGEKNPSVLRQGRYTGTFNQLANKLDKTITNFQAKRRLSKGQVFFQVP